MRILAACLTGCILDCLFGDPYWLYHPVRLIGILITKCEQICRESGKRVKKTIALWWGYSFFRRAPLFRDSSGAVVGICQNDSSVRSFLFREFLVLSDSCGTFFAERERKSI